MKIKMLIANLIQREDPLVGRVINQQGPLRQGELMEMKLIKWLEINDYEGVL